MPFEKYRKKEVILYPKNHFFKTSLFYAVCTSRLFLCRRVFSDILLDSFLDDRRNGLSLFLCRHLKFLYQLFRQVGIHSCVYLIVISTLHLRRGVGLALRLFGFFFCYISIPPFKLHYTIIVRVCQVVILKMFL